MNNSTQVIVISAIIIGSLTFSGSMIAWAKLKGIEIVEEDKFICMSLLP